MSGGVCHCQIKCINGTEIRRMQEKTDFMGTNKIGIMGYSIEAVQMGDKAEFDSSAQMAYNSIRRD